MTLKEFAEMLDNREYGGEMSVHEEAMAKELGVSVFRCRFAVFTVRLGKAIKKILG